MNFGVKPRANNKLYSTLFCLLCIASLTFLLIAFNPQHVSAAQVTLVWDENTEPDLAGYTIHYGTSSGTYPFTEDVGDQTTCILSGLEEGKTYYFAVTAYNTQLIHSDFSVELSKYFPEPDADPEKNLLFALVRPCRIVDTRVAGGAIPPGSVRSYNTWGAVTAQGGNPSGCPSPNAEPCAVYINVTAIPVSGNGNLAIFPFGSSGTNTSMLSYQTDVQNIANAVVAKTCFDCEKEISVASRFGTVHVVIDVMGYYFLN